jgi:enamine deaminase RidA (YjgF/YER057c/UK114 family)
MDQENPPVRACVQAALFQPAQLVEIMGAAVR